MDVRETDFTLEDREAIRKWLNRFHLEDHSKFWVGIATFASTNGFLPKVNDVLWGVLNESRIAEFKKANLGLYSNLTASMCELLATERRWKDCFFHASLKSHLDLNGPTNAGAWEYFSWEPELGFLGSLVCDHLIAPANELGWSVEEARTRFFDAISRHAPMFAGTPTPLSSENTWEKVFDEYGAFFGNPLCQVKTYRVKEPILKLEVIKC